MKAQTFQVRRLTGDDARRDPVGCLCASNEDARKVIRALEIGRRVTIKLQSDRSHEQLALYWRVLERVIEATGRWNTPEELHLALKVATGHVDRVLLLDGRLVLCPGSIAFERMNQEEAQRYYDAALRIVADEIMDCSVEDLVAA